MAGRASSGSKWRRKDGRWGAQFRYKLGGATRTVTTTRRDEAAVDAWLAEKGADLADGVVSGGETVGRFLEEWLKDSVAPRVAYNTLAKRRTAVNVHIAPAIGALPVSDVDPRRVQSLYASMSEAGYAYATRREVHVTLNMALSQAVRWGLARRNPCDLVEAPRDARRGHEEGEVRHLTDAQARRLFAAASGSRWRNYYVVAVRTGLRPGEMLGLRWGDVDLDADPGSVRVRRSLDARGGVVFNPPKGGKARTVALYHEAADAFADQGRLLRSEGHPIGRRDLVFPSASGKPMSADNLRNRTLRPDLERAGLPRVGLHGLRHTMASIYLHEWMLAPAIVSKMMGHADIAFTFRIYGHLIPSADADAVRRLNALHRPPDSGSRTA